MKYVLIGTLGAQWAAKQQERTDAAKAKLAELGITLESVYYVQGAFDFVDVVDAPSSEAMLAFSVWYSSQGYGKFDTHPAFSPDELGAAVAKA